MKTGFDIPKHTGLQCDECTGTWGVYAIPYPHDPEGWVQHYCGAYVGRRFIARPKTIGQVAINLVWFSKLASKIHALKLMGRMPDDNEWFLGG